MQHKRVKVHYISDVEIVNIAEIREHGVGFFEFAKDEEMRQQQLETLKKLRQQVRQLGYVQSSS